MKYKEIAFKQGLWLGVFKIFSQIFSWSVTFIVARILLPIDYGLFEMATVITGYAFLFNELGIGAAIIQRKKVNQNEIASLFWLSVYVTMFFAISCIGIAYITVAIFHNSNLLPITMTVAIVFIVNGLQIVPLNLLKRELKFKKIGYIEFISTIIASSSMLLMAKNGFGVWTLIGGNIILGASKLILIFTQLKWRPKLHFKYSEIKKYVNYGLLFAAGTSFRYIIEKVDRFFAGREWSAANLGLYSFAIGLAQVPIDKIMSLIFQVTFPTLSRYQEDKAQFNSFFLSVVKLIAAITFPIFVGGYVMGDDLIKVLLNEKWFDAIIFFKYLCLVQIFIALNSLNHQVHIALGRANWRLYCNGITAILLSISFYIAVKFGPRAILIPWFTTYVFTFMFYTIITLRKISISMLAYLRAISIPAVSTLTMFIVILMYSYQVKYEIHLIFNLVTNILIGIVIYVGTFFLFDKKYIVKIRKMIKNENIKEGTVA